MREGRPLSLRRSLFTCPQVLRDPIAHARGREIGAFPCGPRGTPARERREGCLLRARSYPRVPRSSLERGAAFSAPSWRGQRESRRGAAPSLRWRTTPVRVLRSLAWVSGAQGAGVCGACRGGDVSGLGRLERRPSCALACKAAGGGAGVHGRTARISLPVVRPSACT